MFEICIRMPAKDSAYQYHQAVWDAVRRGKSDTRDFLYRVIEVGGTALVKVRSHNKLLPTAHGMSPPESEKTYSLQTVLTPKPGKGLFTEKSARSLVERKLTDSGFSVVDLHIQFLRGLTFGKPGFESWVFRRFEVFATVTVLDERLAAEAMRRGIGKGRAFGFGMLELEEIENE